MSVTEFTVEDATLVWPAALGSEVPHSPNIVACMVGAKRSDPTERDVVPARNQRLRNAQFRYGGHA